MLEYERAYDCHLVALIGPILDGAVTYFEEVLLEAECDKDLHLLLVSPGGFGDEAIRLARGAQARCRELVVIVPDQAKSAATLLALARTGS
jgi:ATP-dependent protease ClpP protease subunit